MYMESKVIYYEVSHSQEVVKIFNIHLSEHKYDYRLYAIDSLNIYNQEYQGGQERNLFVRTNVICCEFHLYFCASLDPFQNIQNILIHKHI